MTVRTPIPLRPDVDATRRDAMRSLSRAALASAAFDMDRSVKPLEYAARQWPDDRIVPELMRASTSPTTTTGAGAGLQNIKRAYLRSLIPMSAAADLFSRGLELSFDGYGSISFPAASGAMAYFVSEAAPIPTQNLVSGTGISVSPFKFAALTAMSWEMLRTPAAEQAVEQALIDATAPALDAAVFSNNSGTVGLRPPGLLAGIAALTPSTATDKAEAMADDIQQLVGAIANYSGNGNLTFLASPAQWAAMTLRSARSIAPVLPSASLPAGTVICAALNAVVSVIDPPRIETTSGGAVHEETQPLALVDGSGVLAAPQRSYFQTDSSSIRLIMNVAWGLRAAGALSWMQSVTW